MSQSHETAPIWREGALSLGSNVGDKSQNISQAIAAVDAISGVNVLATSRLFQTAPWGDADQDWFLNACSRIRTNLTAQQLLAALKGIEADMGREKTRRWGPRLIDLDILVLEGTQIDEDALTIPHAQLTNRAFVLVPILDIWPDLIVHSEPIKTHLSRLPREDGDVFPLDSSK